MRAKFHFLFLHVCSTSLCSSLSLRFGPPKKERKKSQSRDGLAAAEEQRLSARRTRTLSGAGGRPLFKSSPFFTRRRHLQIIWHGLLMCVCVCVSVCAPLIPVLISLISFNLLNVSSFTSFISCQPCRSRKKAHPEEGGTVNFCLNQKSSGQSL